MDNNELTSLSVPVRHYAKVVRYLAGLYEMESKSEPANVEPGVAEPISGDTESPMDLEVDGFLPDVMSWNREDIRALRDRPANASTIAIFELANEREDGVANYREIMTRTGRTESQVRADLSGLGKTSNRVFDKPAWPIQLKGTVPTDGKSKYAYRVPKQYLEWWFED